MTECYSARCQQDRKIARREFNKWTKNLLYQIGLETISKHHFEYDVNLFHQNDDEYTPVDFNSEQGCVFCINRQEYLSSKKPINRINEQRHLTSDKIVNDDENAPLDLSLKSTTNNSSTIPSNNRTNLKHRPMFDVKSDIIPPVYGQEEFDRFMSDIITSQIDLSSTPFLNMNLFPTSPTTVPMYYSQVNKKKISSTQDARIAQLAKQMAYERMLQEIDYQRHLSTNQKSKTTINSTFSPSILTESVHVNHILNDVMMRILHETFEKQQQQQQQQLIPPTPQPRASCKGELLFVKKQNKNNDEHFNANIFNNTNIKKQSNDHNNTLNPPSSSSSSSSSVSSTGSSSVHTKLKTKSKLNQSMNSTSKSRSIDMLNNNSKIIIGMDGKQVRPKRGQYRRYESEQLAKAVAAVLSNEMSVHKAGSYFGVPHSTLEYKVKERNMKVSSSTTTKTTKTDHISSASNNDIDDNCSSFIHDDHDIDDDDKSLKGLASCQSPSTDNINSNNQQDLNDNDDIAEQIN